MQHSPPASCRRFFFVSATASGYAAIPPPWNKLVNDRPEEGRLQRKLERANAYLARNDIVAARAAFEAILLARPGFPPAAIPLLRVAEQQGRFRHTHALAVDLFSTSSDEELTLRVAQSLARHGESLDAIQLIQRVRPGGCNDPGMLQQWIQLAILLDETEIAGPMLDRLAALQPASPVVYYQQGVLDIFSGKLEAAEAAVAGSLTAGSENAGGEAGSEMNPD